MKKDENHNVKRKNKTKENINNEKIKKNKVDKIDKTNDFNTIENSKKTKNTDSKLTIILKLILVFCVFILVGMVIFDIHSAIVVDNTLNDVTNELDKIILENKEKIDVVNEENVNVGIVSQPETGVVSQPKRMSVNIGNSKVYGKIKIDKINIEYPIIEFANDDSLWKSICKISNNTINGTGNLCLAGHNMRNLTMFGKLRWVEKGDVIEVTNIYGDMYKYEVYDTFYVEPENVEVTKNTAEPIITLITCNNTSSKRLIVKGKLI